MTSDMVSVAAERLQYALGKARVSLKQLTEKEFNKLLRETLQEINLRELRGFKPLKDFLSRRPGSCTTGQPVDPMEYVEVTEHARVTKDSPIPDFDLKTSVISVSRGLLSQEVTYRRHESGEETSDWNVAHEKWDRQCSVVRATESVLILRRPRDHTRADVNLFEVTYLLEKVIHQSKMEISEVLVSPVPLSNFREHFSNRYAQIARDLIWELESSARKTLEELESQAFAFRQRVTELERLSNAIME